MNRRYDAVIVGGGHNGLVAAGYLARAGLRVRVLEAGSDVGGYRSSAVYDEKTDEWVLNGKKWFITNAKYERTAIFIVMGKSDPGNPDRHRQPSMTSSAVDSSSSAAR